MGILDFNRVPDKALPDRLQDTALNATILDKIKADGVPKWQPNTAYLAGQTVLNPSGDTVTAKADFTSAAAYNAANWNLSGAYAAKSVETSKLDKTEAAAKYVNQVIVTGTGIDPTGTTNSRVAIQALIDAAPAGSVIRFPAGDYLLSHTTAYAAALLTTKKLTFVGDPGARLIASASSAVGLRMIQVGTSATKATGVTVQGLGFEGSLLSQVTCVFVSNADNLTVKENSFSNPGSGALSIQGPLHGLRFTNNTVTGQGYGVLATDDNTSELGGKWKIKDNEFQGPSDRDGIELDAPAVGVTDVQITGNNVSGYTAPTNHTGFGIGLANVHKAIVSENIVSNCQRAGIHLEDGCSDITITTNTVYGSGGSGIEVQSEAALKPVIGVTIDNNNVSGCGSAPPVTNLGRGGIEVGVTLLSPTGGGTAVRGVSVTNNKVHDNAKPGIYLVETPGVITSHNHTWNNVGPGMVVTSCQNSIITENRSTDYQTTKTQTYGLSVLGDPAGLQVGNNNFLGNLTGGVTDGTTGAVFFANQGADTKDSMNVSGGTRRLSFYGVTPIARAAAPAAATDAATTQAAVNALRQKLIDLGLMS